MKKIAEFKEFEEIEEIGWNMECSIQDTNSTYIGLRNLGCTCYMNSLLQVFYHIIPLRESLLKCKCKEEEKNSLYEVQKVFFFLKYLKRGYYVPKSFVNNYDNEVLNVHQQMDVDEFFTNILDKLENRLKGTENENLIKYFFLGRFNDTLTFQEGCNHHRTNVHDFYSIILQVQNKKNIYESLDTLTEGELMNGDNCIFCPQCDKKYPALKRQLFRSLPRMLMFVLKRFEFNFDTMTKFKINDYYEFPKELDMSKYTSEFNDNKDSKQNYKYTLKSIVVHMGHSEGGHYYAYIKDNKTKNWYQFNDTSVRLFDIKELGNETFGGKEAGTNEDKNRSAYLLFYEKIDQSNCETFDKNKALDSLSNKNEKDSNEIINDKNEEFTLFDDEEKKDDSNNINTLKDNESLTNTLSQKIIQRTISDYVNEKLFSREYQHLSLNLYINILNHIDYRKESLPAFFKIMYTLNNEENYSIPFQNEFISYREIKPQGSNLTKYIDKGIIKIFDSADHKETKLSSEEKAAKILELFKYIIIEFFNIIIHAKERKYLGCYVDLIKFLIKRYEYCANYLLEEFSCYNTIIYYLVNCPLYDIKKIIVGIINYAMIKSNQDYLSKLKSIIRDDFVINNENVKEISKQTENEKETIENINNINENNMKERNQDKQGENNINPESKKSNEFNGFVIVNDKQTAEDDTNEINVNNRNKEKDNQREKKREGGGKHSENEKISQNVLKLLNNCMHVFENIDPNKYRVALRFIFAILLKFSLLSSEARNYLVQNTRIISLLNHIVLNYRTYYSNNRGYYKISHEILNPNPFGKVLGENDNKAQFIELNYDFMLLCNLLFYEEKPKEETDDIECSFWSENYIYQLVSNAKTKQDIKYLSYLINKKCKDNSEIFKKLLVVLEHCIRKKTDCEKTFYDECDEDKRYEIYRNINCKSDRGFTHILIKNNLHVIFRKVILVISEKDTKELLDLLFDCFNDYRKYYGISIFIVNMIIDLFEVKNMIKNYARSINDVYNWLNKFKVPPKYYNIRGIDMYRNEDVYNAPMESSFKKEFDKVETAKTDKKIKRLDIIRNKDNQNEIKNIDISNLDCDVSDFTFTIGDQVIYDNKVYEITNCLDELLKIRLIDGNKQADNKKDFIRKEFNQKEKNSKEKSIWVETDNYKLRIKKLININK